MADRSDDFVVASRSQSNKLGVAGFIVGIVGIATCGLLSPIALGLSLFGMSKQPRGLAIAGLVMGVIGTVMLTIAGLLYLDFTLTMKRNEIRIREHAENEARAEFGAKLVEDFAKKNRRLPTQDEARGLFAPQVDPTGKIVVYEPKEDGSFSITAIGADGKPGTRDDYETSRP